MQSSEIKGAGRTVEEYENEARIFREMGAYRGEDRLRFIQQERDRWNAENPNPPGVVPLSVEYADPSPGNPRYDVYPASKIRIHADQVPSRLGAEDRPEKALEATKAKMGRRKSNRARDHYGWTFLPQGIETILPGRIRIETAVDIAVTTFLTVGIVLGILAIYLMLRR